MSVSEQSVCFHIVSLRLDPQHCIKLDVMATFNFQLDTTHEKSLNERLSTLGWPMGMSVEG